MPPVRAPEHCVMPPSCGIALLQNAFVPAWLYKLELRRGSSVSLSGLDRRILVVYFGWEVANLFLGGVMASSLLR